MDSAAISALAAFFGGVVVVTLNSIISTRLAHKDRKENRRKERQMYLVASLKRLTELRAKLEYLQDEEKKSSSHIRERKEAFGEAYAILKGVSDNQIRQLASRIIGPDYFMDQIALSIAEDFERTLGNEKDMRIDALDKAIVRLGDLIDETMI